MVPLKKVMELNSPFISAASGLVDWHGKFFVVADDESFLCAYDKQTHQGTRFPILNEVLPADLMQRKKSKRDYEALVLLPQQDRLLLVPSGSTPKRERGGLINQAGQLEREISFQAIYAEIKKTFPEINIEGGVVVGPDLWLFQRGNGLKNQNGIIIFNLLDFLSNHPLNFKFLSLELGIMAGANLSFTDATKVDRNILFLAVAEDTTSTYLDGQVMGSIIGLMNLKGEVLAVSPLATKSKPEGISYSTTEHCFYVVTDDDNRQNPSILLRGYLPASWNIHFE